MKRVLLILAAVATVLVVAACTQTQAEDIAQAYGQNACAQSGATCTVPLPGCTRESGFWHCVGSYSWTEPRQQGSCEYRVDVYDTSPVERNGSVGPCVVGP